MTTQGESEAARAHGAQIRRLRRAAGLTQEALAERAGVSVRTISDLERGIARTPHRETADLLAAALGLPPPGRVAFPDAARGLASPRAGAISPPLVGRGHELALLQRHLAGDGPPLLLLAGEPGIGKSRLLREAAAMARDAGWRVLAGGCTRGDGQEPFAPLAQALQGAVEAVPLADRRRVLQGCAWLARLLPELAGQGVEAPPSEAVPPGHERRLVFAAVARFLQNLRVPAGTLLLLDDLQWAGQDALDLLAVLLPGDAPPRVLGAYRGNEVASSFPPHPLDTLMADAASAGLVAHHAVGPLAPAEARALLAALVAPGEGLPAAVGETVVARADGVPFFLISFAWALRQEARPEPGQVPWHVRQSITQRLAALPAAAREVVRVAAALGRSSPYSVLAAAGLREHALVPALAAACHAGLLAEEGDGYAFVHDVVRETVVGELGLAQRRALHRRAAAAWEAQPVPAPVEALAYHHRQAGDAKRAARYLLLAGERAEARYAHAAAADHYREAATCLLALGHAAEAARAQARLGEMLSILRRFDDALHALGQASRTFEQTGDLDRLGRVLSTKREIYYVLDRPDQFLDLVKPAIRRFEDAGPSRGLAWLYNVLLIELIARMQYHAAAMLLERLDCVLPAVEDERLRMEVEVKRGLLLHLLRRNDEALAALEHALQRAEALERAGAASSDAAYGCFIAAEIHFFSGRFPEAARHLEAAIALSKRQGDPEGGAYYVGAMGYLAIHRGDVRGAKQHLEDALALMRGTAYGQVNSDLLREFGFYHMVVGDYAAARDALEASRGEYPEVWLDWLLAELDLLEGRAEQVRAQLLPLVARQIGPDVYDLGLTEREREITPPHLGFVLPRLAWAHLQLRELEEAERVAAWARAYAEEEGNRVALVEALRIQALLHGERQRWPEAEAALEEGLFLARTMPYPYAEARLLHVYGTQHGQRGEAAAARARLEAALAIFQRLGARKHADEAMYDLATLAPE